MNYTMTNDTVTVYHNGKNNTVRRGASNFMQLRNALAAEDWVAAELALSVKTALLAWAKGKFKIEGNIITHDGEELPQALSQRIMKMSELGEDAGPVCKFWEKLKKNPSKRSVDQLWPFLDQKGIPLTPEGNFLAYKGVRSDFKDAHSGMFDNSPGAVNEMPRNKISDDPNEACHEGFHVGALEYARTFSERVVICEVDPADVVCIPYDHSHQKMRVSKYKVIGNHNGQFLSNTVNDAEIPDIDVDMDDDDNQCQDGDCGWCDNCDDEQNDEPCDDCSGCDDCDPKEEVRVVAPVGFIVPKKYDRFQKLETFQLFNETMETLRDYARNGLKIVGASKIPGGKIALVDVIERTRDSRK